MNPGARPADRGAARARPTRSSRRSTLTERQTDAIVRRELDRINGAVAVASSARSSRAEARGAPHGFAAELADALGIEPGESTLSTLAAALPRNEANALLRAGETVIRAVEKLARRSVANRQLLEHELAVIDQVMRIAHRGDRSTYAGTRHLLRVPDRDPGRARLMGVSTFNGINVALRGLIAQQRALDVTTHNIANANTEGYTRQEAVLEAADPISNVSVWGMLFPGQLGQGVTVDSYRRIRDVFNDVQLRAATSEQAVARRPLPRAARDLAGDPRAVRQRHPVARCQDFFNAWHDVANAPESLAARQALAQAGAVARRRRSTTPRPRSRRCGRTTTPRSTPTSATPTRSSARSRR